MEVSEYKDYPLISIHALREEGDLTLKARLLKIEAFLSTPSARRATCTPSLKMDPHTRFLSTPSARRATNCNNFAVASSKISIHALREEGDRKGRGVDPLGRSISIHALREEGDSPRWCRRCPAKYFYPRPPRGGRPGR